MFKTLLNWHKHNKYNDRDNFLENIKIIRKTFLKSKIFVITTIAY